MQNTIDCIFVLKMEKITRIEYADIAIISFQLNNSFEENDIQLVPEFLLEGLQIFFKGKLLRQKYHF